MKAAHLMSRLLLLIAGIAPFQLTIGSPTDQGGPDTLIVTSDGSVKSIEELNSTDTVIAIRPLTSTDNGTLTVGNFNAICGTGPGGVDHTYGNVGSGSYSPTGLTGGTTVNEILDNNGAFGGCAAVLSVFSAKGFSANPGSAWLSSITCNGVMKTGASASSFSYSNGFAFWQWSTLFGLAAKNGSNVSCSIVHN